MIWIRSVLSVRSSIRKFGQKLESSENCSVDGAELYAVYHAIACEDVRYKNDFVALL